MSDEYVGPTPERISMAEAGDVTPIKTESGRSTVRIDGSPVARLYKRRKLTPAQFSAAERLYGDAYGAGFMASGVIDTTAERVDCMGRGDISDYRLACQTRYNHAMRAMSADDWRIISDVVLSETPVAIYADRLRVTITRADGKPLYGDSETLTAIATALLSRALTNLDRHYNPPRNRGIRD